ncbi:MAG: Protein translocase subunit SecY [candidate division WS6 bacterium GW2011_GWF2_39_15]|uniref:Protein translocase subunit SecY n=1 Tax=candidate division WS6 bacterium GW2011_GWF2_39_15 TaxID=1619100 RepID=A0A0G0MNN4_9BACT|nr:MAG: Protein translocase subunit SecY [candidate division WS6 bacterium GW2011_GWF2_39_15]
MLKNILNTIRLYWRTEEIRKKVFFSLLVLIVFRVLASIPVVGIPAKALSQLFAGSNFGDLLSTISGGVLETASIAAIGLTPYINASVTIQLLTPVIPKLEELRKEGSNGRRIISLYTRLLTVPLAILQSFIIYSTLRGFNLMPVLDSMELLAMSATLTAGSIVIMWLGELLSESGLGNGSSFLIFLGILAGIPGALTGNLKFMDPTQKIIFVLLNLALVAVVVLISEAERRIKVQYSRRVRTGGSAESFIPLKLTQSGVMPVIFAISLLSFPELIGRFLLSRNINDTVNLYSTNVINFLSNPYVQNIGMFLLIISFSFFYVTVVFNTKEIAENLQKNGGFIQGIRPGSSTAKYLRSISFRLTAVGATILALLSVLPNVLLSFGLISQALITGTGLLIVIGVVLDMRRQVRSMAVVKDYGRYI